MRRSWASVEASIGAPGIGDFGALESAVAQPKATFGGSDLYPALADKAAALLCGVGSGPPFRRWQQARRARRYGDSSTTFPQRDIAHQAGAGTARGSSVVLAWRLPRNRRP